jgi:hypothetical protein
MNKVNKKDDEGSNRFTAVPKKRGRPKKSKVTKEPRKRSKSIKQFRISAKNLILTYAKCTLSIEEIYEAVMERLKDYKVKDYLFVNEKHEDGSDHFHVLLSCDKKVDRKGSSFLDVEVASKNGEKLIFHGNYEKCKSEADALSYLTKDIFTPEDAVSRMKISEGYSRRLGEIYQVLSLDQRMIALAEQDRVFDAISLLKLEDPRRYLEQGSRIERRLKELVLEGAGCESDYPFDSYTLPDGLEQALALFKRSIELGEAKTLVVQGPPGCGKTTMLKAFLRQKLKRSVLVVSNTESLALFDKNIYDAILLDDPNFETDNRERLRQILDCDMNIIKVRYRNITIPANTPRVLATNIPVETLSPHFKDGALKRRMIEWDIDDSTVLYDRKRTQDFLPNDQSELGKERIKFYKDLEDHYKDVKRSREQ